MADSRLFQPLKLGRHTLQHRIAMAPLTRFRASDEHVPVPELAATYYGQRASVPGTLLVTEATFISRTAGGYDNVPGIYSAAQAAGWRHVTDAVHARGSFIFCQLCMQQFGIVYSPFAAVSRIVFAPETANMLADSAPKPP